MGVDTHFTITKSVFSSGAANDDVVSNDVNCAAIFDSVTDSVIYFPNMDNASALLGISGNDALKGLNYSGREAAVGGVVFCDWLIENNNFISYDLSGAFISLSDVSDAQFMNNKLTGGILISYKGQVITNNTNAEDATIGHL